VVFFRIFVCLCSLLFLASNSHAQRRGVLIKNSPIELFKTLQQSHDTQWFSSIDESEKYLHDLSWKLYNLGYLSARFNVIQQSELLTEYELIAGKKFVLAEVVLDDALKDWKQDLNIKKNEAMGPDKLAIKCQKVLKELETNGYPFAQIKCETLLATDSSVGLNLSLNLGTFYTYDSMRIEGNSKLSKNYLEQYLNVKKGQPYNEQNVKQIDLLLDRLLLVKRTKSSEVYFVYNKIVLKIYIDERSTDRFDGIIGFAPNSNAAANNSLLFTGEINLDLKNIANRGISFYTGWKSYLARSQQLDIKGHVPFVFNTPLFIGASGQIAKFDSLFLDTRFDLQVGIIKGGNRQWSIKYGQSASSLLSVDTTFIRSSAKLPANNPYQITRYGAGLQWNLLDRVSNPTKGYLLHAEAFIGIRTLLRDNKINQVQFFSGNFPEGISIYDTINKKQTRGEIFLDQQFYFPIKGNTTLVFRYLGSYLISKNIYFNELYKFGGFSSLRGFDERSIFASSFSMINTEFRYIINNESYAGIFVNGAYTENHFKDSPTKFSDFPFGFGASVQLNTGRSLLQMSYALGNSANQPLAFKTAKVHFGLINYIR
jgi:outer membrane protein assembly factor BamA